MGVWDWFRRTFGSAPAEEASEPPAPEREAAPMATAPAPAKPAAPKQQAKPKPANKPKRDKPKKPNKRRGVRPPGWTRTEPPERPAPVVVAEPEPEPEPEPPPVPEPVAAEPEAPSPREGKGREGKGQGLLAWVVVPKLEELLAEVDALPAEADREVLVRARSRFVREWRAVGKIPTEHADALRAAHDERVRGLDERIAAFPDPRAEEQVRHVEAREALITEALALATHDDLKDAIARAKDLQRRWRDAPRLPRDAMGDLGDRFKAAIDAVFARREEQNAKRLTTLSALVASAEALTRAEDPVRAADAMKHLQARWKETGGVRGEQGDALWTRFRAAADAIFERRRTHFQAQHEANVAAREALIAEAEAKAGHEPADPDDVIRGLMRRWKRIGPVPREQNDALWERFRAACDRLRDPAGVPPEALGDGQDTLRFNPFARLGDD